MRKSLKTVIVTALATVAMTMTAVAGYSSYSTTFTVGEGTSVYPSMATFSKEKDHTMNVEFGTVSYAGDAAVGISKRTIFGNYKCLASSTFYLKKGNYTGVHYVIKFNNISAGERYYGFTADMNTRYSVKSYNDSW